jgi:hypothetical protein
LTESLLAKIQNHHCGRNIRNLTITHKGNFIILSGKTSSFYLKQVVQELISKDVFAVNLGLQDLRRESPYFPKESLVAKRATVGSETATKPL